MGYAETSNAGIAIALWTAYGLFGASFLCLFASLTLRFFRYRKERKQKRLEAIWRPVIYAVVSGEIPTDLPRLKQRDIPNFGIVWLSLYQRVRGDSAQSLLDLLTALSIPEALPKLLQSRSTDNKLIALMLMTALKDERALPHAQALFDHSYDLLSHMAAKMLMVRSPETAIPMVLSRLTQQNWPLHKINSLFDTVPSEILLLDFLSQAIATAPQSHIPLLLDIVHTQAEREFGAIARNALARFPDDADIIITVLSLTISPHFTPLARTACRHENTLVRRAGITAIAKLSLDDEQLVLEQALNDNDWLTQRCAATALMSLPTMTSTKAQTLLNSLPEGMARSHLLEAMYHKGWLLPDSWQATEAV
ncbi:MAG: HEAT repeat domain-containing protein [Moraxellaceae bacterium]|nr:HEAT repeat domain-containing protein [Moraxellaceae bacterium]MDZ4297956.1 HEAT repeat domain-containing protein [Moraxellaceae bacterium]MDZ4387586.1 HEAT repeat domain-containing protein [Moraxellaceae bacterium]